LTISFSNLFDEKWLRKAFDALSGWKKPFNKFLRPSEDGALISNSVQDKGKIYVRFDWKGEKRRCLSRQNIFVFDRPRCNTEKGNFRDNLHESAIQEISPVRVYTMYDEQILKSLLQLQQFSSDKIQQQNISCYSMIFARVENKLIRASYKFHKNEYD